MRYFQRSLNRCKELWLKVLFRERFRMNEEYRPLEAEAVIAFQSAAGLHPTCRQVPPGFADRNGERRPSPGPSR